MSFDSPEGGSVKKSWADGHIAIVESFDTASNQAQEEVDILGVRLKRRTAASGLPGFQGNEKQFADLSFSEPEIRYLQAILMRQAIGHHSLFLGPPGLGKSRMAQFAAFLLNIPFYRIQCKKGMNVTRSFLWTFLPTDEGGWKGRYGRLALAMQQGAMILVDELPNLPAEDRQSILEPTERPNRPDIHGAPPTLTLEDFPGGETTVVAKKGFFLLATGNYHEGQGVGEIHPVTDRETRRVRPFMMGSLPDYIRPRRAVGRWHGPKGNVALNGFKRMEYYPHSGESILPEETGDLVAALFQEVENTLTREVLPNARQEPPVYFTEAMERAYDHFETFQIRKSQEPGTPIERRTKEVMASAVAALEFYFLNSFREETKIRVPNELQDDYKTDEINKAKFGSSGQILEPAKMDDSGRTGVRDYIRWKIKRIIAGATVTVGTAQESFTSRVQKSLEQGVKVEEQKEKIKLLASQQFPLAMGLLQKLLGPSVPMPNLEQVRKSLAQMNASELKTFLEMKTPTLLLKPTLAPAKYRAAFDAQFPGKRAEKIDVNAVWDSQSTGALEFETIVVEGSDEPNPIQGDNPSETLQQRCTKNPENLLDMESYYLLYMRALQTKTAIDTTTQTITSLENTERIAVGSGSTGLLDTPLKKKALSIPTAKFRKFIRKPIA